MSNSLYKYLNAYSLSLLIVLVVMKHLWPLDKVKGIDTGKRLTGEEGGSCNQSISEIWKSLWKSLSCKVICKLRNSFKLINIGDKGDF
jgi:hypothetical protein